MLERQELGEIYRELRLARGLTLKDVAGDKLSIAQLSKFENGQSTLTAEKLLVALEGIHMSFSEFGLMMTRYQDNDFSKLGKTLLHLHLKQDISGLRQLLSEFSQEEPLTTYNRLNRLVVKVVLSTLDSSCLITVEEREFLATYLYEVEEWTDYELYLFGNTLMILSDSDLIFLGKAFVEKERLSQSLSAHRNKTELVLLNLIHTLIKRRNYQAAHYFIESLEKILEYRDMFAVTVLNFFNLIVTYLENESTDQSALLDYIQAVKTLGNGLLAKFLEEELHNLLA